MEWCGHVSDDSRKLGDGTREKFFEYLFDVLQQDLTEVHNEWRALNNERYERERLRAAQQLNIPANTDEWTTENKQKQRCVDSGTLVIPLHGPLEFIYATS